MHDLLIGCADAALVSEIMNLVTSSTKRLYGGAWKILVQQESHAGTHSPGTTEHLNSRTTTGGEEIGEAGAVLKIGNSGINHLFPFEMHVFGRRSADVVSNYCLISDDAIIIFPA